MELKAVFLRVVNTANGQGKNGPWTKTEFITETRGPHPKTVCLTAWNDKGDMLPGLAEGEALTIGFEIESREYNSRWYSENRVFSLSVDATGESTGGATPKASGSTPTKVKAPATPTHSHSGNYSRKQSEETERHYVTTGDEGDDSYSDLPF